MLNAPRVNDLVEVAPGPEGPWLASRIEGARGDEFVLAAPFGPHLEVIPARPGARVLLRWRAARGIGSIETRVVASSRGRPPRWWVRALGEGAVDQRRRFVRIPVVLTVEAWRDATTWMFTATDLSEGGLRSQAPLGIPWTPDAETELHFDVDAHRIAALGRLVWWTPAPTGSVVAFRFVGLGRPLADRLRRFVFTHETRHRHLLRR